jgi:hypothetical protein
LTNFSSKYPTIGRSMTFNTAPRRQAAHKLNLNFSMVQLHTLIELMQRLALKRCPSRSQSSKGLN